MKSLADILSGLPASWREKADDLDALAAAAQATSLRWCASQLETALAAAADEALTLEQAATESGYSPERLRKLIADGTIPQAGRKHAPRVKRGDLPSRARRPASAYSADEDALRLVRGS